MASFAVSVRFLLSRPNASMPYKPGYEEDGFLKSLSPLKLTEIELLASNCTEVCISILYVLCLQMAISKIAIRNEEEQNINYNLISFKKKDLSR